MSNIYLLQTKRLARELNLSHALLQSLVANLMFATTPRPIIRRGGEFILILEPDYSAMTETQLAAAINAIHPRLVYKGKSARGGHKLEADCTWVYIAIQPVNKPRPVDDGMPRTVRPWWPERFRQEIHEPLWSFL